MHRLQRVFLLVLLFALAVRFAAAEDETPLRFPALPEDFQEGEPLKLAVASTPEAGPFEYQWATRFDDAPWKMGAWTANPLFVATPEAPGVLAVQVNVRRAGETEPFVQKWLGQAFVQGELARRVLVEPPMTALPVGTPLSFWMEPRPGTDVDALECRLWVQIPEDRATTPTWKTARDWGPWPPEPFVLPRSPSGVTALQVDLRLREQPRLTQKMWLGNYYPQDADLQGVSLLRALIADDFERLTHDEATRILGQELALAVCLLNGEAEGLDSEQQIERLKECFPTSASVRRVANGASVRFEKGQSYSADLETRRFHEQGSPVHLDLSLGAFPQYARLFETCSGLERDERLLAGICFALYEGYWYGPLPNYLLESPATPVSHCGSAALQLHDLLESLGFDARFAGADRRGTSDAHLIVEAAGRGPNARRILLDPTAGLLYLFAAERLGEANLPKPLRFPRVRNLDFLDMTIRSAEDYVFTVFDDYRPGVFWLRPAESAPAAVPRETP